MIRQSQDSERGKKYTMISSANKQHCLLDNDEDDKVNVDTQQQTVQVVATSCNSLDSWLDSYRRFQQQHGHQQQNHGRGGFLFVWIKVQFMIVLEIVLSWIVCILCAIYYISRYQIETWTIQRTLRTRRRRRRISSQRQSGDTSDEDDDDDDLLFSLPLMTEARHLKQQQQQQREDLLANMDQQYEALKKLLDDDDDDDDKDDRSKDRQLVDIIRNSSPDVRHLVSRFMVMGMEFLLAAQSNNQQHQHPHQHQRDHQELQHKQQQQHDSSATMTVTTTTTPTSWMLLHQQLKRIWPHLLQLPPLLSQPPQEGEEEEEPIAASTLATKSSMHDSSSASSCTASCISSPCDCLKDRDSSSFDIALIVPAYAESGRVLRRTLLCARDHCRHAQKVVVVVVNAGGQCSDLHLLQQTFATSSSSSSTTTTASSSSSNCSCQQDDKHDTTITFIAVSSSSSSSWGAFALIPFKQHEHQQSCSGRGPTLNYGAAWVQSHISSSRRKRPLILTFLHADTLLPQDWDVHVQKALVLSNDDDANDFDSSSLHRRRGQANRSTNQNKIVQACAFSFGHDLSDEGLSLYHGGTDKNDNTLSSSSSTSLSSLFRYPWGIRAVQWLGNLRATWARLPYGDHVISMPDVYFHYLGGFPNQPIMEDYELMDLLRKRARILNDGVGDGVVGMEEGIAIIPAQARCSTRRWQKHGVVYTTLVNALIVHRYSRRHNAWTPDDVFGYYYNNNDDNNNNNIACQEREEEQHHPSPGTTTTTTTATSENSSSNKKDD